MKHSILAFTLALMAVGCSSEQQSPHDYKLLELQEVMVVGAEDEVAAEGLLAFPSNVVADSRGNIYVFDRGGMQMKKYGPYGKFQQAFFSEGEGPGEFKQFGGVTISADDHIFVLDGRNYRLTQIDTLGASVAQVKVETFVSSRMHVRDSETLLILNYDPNQVDQAWSTHLIKEFSLEHGRVEGGLMEASTVIPEDDFVLSNSAQARIGSAYFAEESVVFVPLLYTGRLYEQPLDGARMTAHGRSEEEAWPAYTHVEDPSGDNSTLIIYRAGKRVGANIPVESRGLFKLDSGGYAHFIQVVNEDEAFWGLEHYAEDWTLLDVYKIRDLEHTEDSMPNLEWFVEWKDQRGNFYMIDREDIPVVRVFKVAL
ncbi:MAG: hypothetical protein AAF730_11925 [Bacteroidota bacterium]